MSIDLHTEMQGASDHCTSGTQPQSLVSPSITGGEIEPCLDLNTCVSVQYKLRDSVQGVKFVRSPTSCEEWSPIVRSNVHMKRSTESDGSINSPTISTTPRLPNLQCAKDLAFYKLDGVPGFCYRAGRTKHSYSWVLIVASPIAN